MSLVGQIASLQDYKEYEDLNWEGSFEEYLHLVRKNPRVTRNAFQRAYDMILAHGQEEYIDNKKKLVRYKFFKDEVHEGADAVYGLDVPLMRLMSVFKSAAQGYGTERRVILLHGPVGSAKSTIVRLLKKGLEEYSRTPDGALFTYFWTLPGELSRLAGGSETFPCPMHDEPLRLIPREWRLTAMPKLALGNDDYKVKIEGDVNPACRWIFRELMAHYKGDFEKVIKHVRVKRLVLSEQDRVGIGTFQPKDEKNQDSTELTGDINYRKIAEFGSDSDPRAFNFDGEFNIANRGIIEFVEILKLDVAFLYDLLGATQEHRIKPKKFAQTDIDEVHPRPHKRGRVQEAPQQRVHGGAARSNRQGRRPVHHARLRRGEDLHQGLHLRARRQARRAAHAVRRGAVGGADPARGAQEAEPDRLAEGQALRRQAPARLHPGQHQGAAQGGGARGPRRHLAALRAGQDLQRPGQRQG